MSLKKPKNLLIIGAVIVALLAGTVLLGNYANILPAGSDTQAKTCKAAGGTPCCGAKVSSNESAQAAFAQQTGAGFDAKACPLGRTEPCCAGDAAKCCCPAKCCPDKCENCCCPDECDKCCCPKLCPPGCTKPCCAGEAATGCCPMSSPS
jgi:hypothetical protein